MWINAKMCNLGQLFFGPRFPDLDHVLAYISGPTGPIELIFEIWPGGKNTEKMRPIWANRTNFFLDLDFLDLTYLACPLGPYWGSVKISAQSDQKWPRFAMITQLSSRWMSPLKILEGDLGGDLSYPLSHKIWVYPTP